jgi:hypothetical protein
MTPASLNSLQRRLKDRIRARRKRSGSSGRCRTSFRPSIDQLEKRNLLTTFMVINPIDGEEGSLRDAIEQANATTGPDTIKFDLDVQDIQVSGQIVITDKLTIDGPGADELSVLGDGDRVFAVVPSKYAEETDLFTTPTPDQLADAPSVKIEGLTIANGIAFNALGLDLSSGFSFGGGIYNLGSEVHLDRVQMTFNTAVGAVTAGGAVANEFGGTLTVSRSDFDHNTSAGAVIAVGGAITSDSGPTNDGTEEGGVTQPPVVSIDRSSFVENTAEAQDFGYLGGPFTGLGGGGAILNVTGEMTITRSHFESNEAIGGPGNVGTLSGGAGFGGAILTGDVSPFGVADSSLAVSRSTFAGNTATGGSSSAENVPGGIASGGAISVGNGSDAVLERNTFDSNAVIGGAGGLDADGGIGNGGGVSGAGFATLELERNKFIENSAQGGSGGGGDGQDAAGRGGGLGLDSISLAGFVPGTATASSESDTFQGNVAYGGIGGGIYNEGELTLEKSSLKENQAIGLPEVGIDFVPGYSFVGVALGGGISNIGSLEASKVNFKSNQAIGADGAVGLLALAVGSANYPGLAVGGGLHNITEATVTRSHFVGNEALGGNNNFGSFAGVSNGGGIYNDGSLELSRSTIEDNRAVGGNDNVGDINAGGGYGGGLTSGSVTLLNPDPLPVRSAELHVERSSVVSNEAVGGDSNGIFPLPLPFELPAAHLPAGGIGGGILVFQGEADISRTEIVNNLAAGGEGGLAAGGGVFFFGFVGTVNAELSRSVVANNTAVGGTGGDGLGGGIAIGGLGSLFAANFPGVPNVVVEIQRTDVIGNTAQGGTGANGLGGGIYNGVDADTVLYRSEVSENQALAGLGGEGIGGGVYNLGDLEEIHAEIFGNFASTSDDDCFGC